LITFILALLSPNNLAQDKFSLLLGGGYINSTTMISQTKLSYWDKGYSFDVASDYKISNDATIFFAASYQIILFNEKLVSYAVPAVAGYDFKIAGDNSLVVDLSIGGKYYASSSIVKTYLEAGIGALYISQGKVAPISDTGNNYLIAQTNFGLGAEINLISNLQLVVEGKVVAGSGLMYCPITSSIKFGL
jgi:hypothetical protein